MNFLDLLKGTRDQIMKRAQAAINWYRNLSNRFSRNNIPGQRQPPDFPFNYTNSGGPSDGRMYFFHYIAQDFIDGKNRLPYWDMSPLIIGMGPAPAGKNGAGFYGLNFHYLPPDQRANLLNAMKLHLDTGDTKELYKLMVSYQAMAANINRYPGFDRCFKRYLFKNAVGFKLIPPTEWEHVVMLPLQQWHVNRPPLPY